MSALQNSWLTTARRANRFRASFTLCPRCRHRFYNKLYIKENDIVLLKKRGSDDAKPILTKCLRPADKIETHRGTIDHASLIGKEIRDVVYTTKGVGYRIHQPTLAEYVTLSPRTVTPVYPADANLIVSLLDIHPPDEGVIDEPFEIFEAGTGHGALTLHLARAIHGLNPVPPPLPPITSDKFSKGEPRPEYPNASPSNQVMPTYGEFSKYEPNLQSGDVPNYDTNPQSLDKRTTSPEHKSAEEVRFEAYLPTRRAVIHTLDLSPAFSKYAQNIVRRFRRGLYYHNIDFHVGTILEYLSSRLATTPEPFLEHAILDLPSPQEHLEIVGQALKPNGSLIVFCPSITQIADCVKLVQEKRLPFHLESVLELGAGIGVGGREWDVRLVKPRAVLKAEAEASKVEEQSDALSNLDSTSDGKSLLTTSKESGWAMVCRPKVGARVTGGGFLGLWRRICVNSAPRTPRTQPVVTTEDESASEPL